LALEEESEAETRPSTPLPKPVSRLSEAPIDTLDYRPTGSIPALTT
jgi:hypothetical protein